MLTQAFYTGIAGIKTHQSAIDVTADNLANVSTIGYKGYSTEFASLLEDSINTTSKNTSNTIGIGSRIQTTNMSGGVGSIILTERNTDIAIRGDGWFGVTDDTSVQYTRAGNFTFDENNDLVTNDGFYVMGTKGGNISGETLSSVIDEIKLGDVNSQEKLRFPKNLSYPAEPTTNVNFFGNLGLKDVSRTISVATTAVDKFSNRNNLQLILSKSETQVPPGLQWDVTATTTSLDGETLYDTQEGVLSFDASGSLISSTLTSINNNGTQVNINLGENYNGIVVTNGPITTSSTANGTIGGVLRGYEINRNAEVIATFTNGKQSSVGKIALFHFQNDAGLNRVSGTRFEQSPNSGDPIFFKDANGNNILGATVNNFTLENSNIKLENALTELIILQRSFDANSKSISAANEMMQKALNMDA